MPTWDAAQYLRFADNRTRPAADLLARVAVESPRTVVDVGCGPGNSTALLRERWPDADITGLDSSAEMLAKARVDHPGTRWLHADLTTWVAPQPCDVIFSNAALQWVRDHGRVLPHLFGQIAAGGALAVQIPAHLESPVHRAMLAIAEEPAWRDRMTAARTAVHAEEAAFYYDLLSPLASRVDLWVTEYQHVLDSPAAILDWMRGTGLRPFLQALADDAERGRFEALLLPAVERGYPRRRDGRVLFPFRRLFLIAYRQE